MNAPQMPLLDSRRAQEVLLELLARRAGYLPNWKPSEDAGDAALLKILARYAETLIQRLNQAPQKNMLAFLDMMGIDLIPAQAARVPIVFRMAADAPTTRAAAGTRVVAPPPPESTDQIVFETEEGVGLMSGRLKEVISLWPGRDQFINHSAAVAAGEPFQPFSRRQLQNTPHHLYIAHDRLLALDGQTTVQVQFDLAQGSSEHLNVAWEYWDGEIWRTFAYIDPDCSSYNADLVDSTRGFQSSGRFILQTEFAETKKTTVNGIESFWIRARLREPLPPDPAQILPLVDRLQLSTLIKQPLEATITDEEISQQNSNYGASRNSISMSMALYFISAYNDNVTTGDQPEENDTSRVPKKEFENSQESTGLRPESAYSNAEQLDTSKPFYPLGQFPQPGSVFYFSASEIFSKPGAQVEVYIAKANTPSEPLDSYSLSPQVNWEYWNGRQWRSLEPETLHPPDSSNCSPTNFTATGLFTFTVPDDIRSVDVNGEEALWLRANLYSGGYEIKKKISTAGGEIEYEAIQPPAIAEFLLGYTWQYGPFYPQAVIAYNDFQYENVTNAATWPGQQFSPFQLVRDTTPGLYLGFDQPLPVDRSNLFINILEDQNELEGPALLWEYWDGFAWQSVSVTDATNKLRLPGTVSLIGPADARSLNRFTGSGFASDSLYWLRARLKEDGPPGAPTINAIYPNAVWAAQRQTVLNEQLGTSNGRPHQSFICRQLPVLPGEQIEVRELVGARANVDWRMVAAEILGEDYTIIQRLQERLNQEGPQTEIVEGQVRLERDRHKRVTAVWVTWEARDHFYASDHLDRHYVLERSRGQLRFGDGIQGMAPPAGAMITARQYRSGGGTKGNVKANTVTQLLAGIGGVEAIFNPIPGEGGAEGEAPTQAAARGPYTLRHRQQALTAKDYETMAYEASPAVAVARALPTRDAAGRPRPGWITVIIIPHSQVKRPSPSYGLREAVRRYITDRAPADLAGLAVIGPNYQAVGIDAVIVPVNSADAAPVEQRAREALERFLHPLRGGPDEQGWLPGRDVYLSDIASMLERVVGLDAVTELTLLDENVPQGERLRVGNNRIAVAGDFRIRVTELQNERIRR